MQLKNPRLLWGNPFDGTKDINGTKNSSHKR
jgi:hypothetical protein